MGPKCSTRDGKQVTGTLIHSLRGGLAGSLNGARVGADQGFGPEGWLE